MATSEYCGDDEGNNAAGLTKWPLEYVKETEEFTCGWCGHVFTLNHTHREIKTHFESCKNTKETGLLVGFKDLLKVNQKIEGLNADVRTRVDQMKAELMGEIQTELLNIKAELRTEISLDRTEFNTKILDLKSDIKKDSEKDLASKKTSDAAVTTMLNKFNILEAETKEKMREMGVDVEKKMVEVNGRFTGVTETISTVVHSILEVRGKDSGTSSNTDEVAKKETETVRVKSEGEIQTTKTGSEDEVARLKAMKTNDEDCRLIKRKMEDEKASKHLAKKNKSFQEATSLSNQLTVPMNCFNLSTQNYPFQPSYKWTVGKIKSITARKTFELSSEWFRCNGYTTIQARAKLQQKRDGRVYISLCLKDALNNEEFKIIPQVYYLLKNINLRNIKHKCSNMGYALSLNLKYSLECEAFLCRKSLLNNSEYNANDSIEIEIYVEPPLMAQQVHSYDGTLEWNIENYRRKLQFEKNRLVLYQESPYFYTGPNGYRVQVRMYLNGDEGGSGPTARILFLTGKFDDDLPKSFPHSTTVTLINRKEPEKSVNKTVAEDIKNKREYMFEICKFEEMKNVVENDTLFCKVLIKSPQQLN